MIFLLILIKLFWTLSDGDQQVGIEPSDWSNIAETDNIYHISKASTSWPNALRYCGSRNSHLVTFESRKEETQVLALISAVDKGRFEYWTSGTNLLKNEGFTWISNGRAFKGNYYNFCTADLMNLWNDDHCVVANDRRNCWQTRNCDSMSRFICEMGTNVYLDD